MDDHKQESAEMSGEVPVATINHPHKFEINPSRRNRQKNRLMHKLDQLLSEIDFKCNVQAVAILVGRGQNKCQVIGSKPLQNAIQNCSETIIKNLETELNIKKEKMESTETNDQFYLPPLVTDGIPTPLKYLTQGQLRSFIPRLLKHATGRKTPGWGMARFKPEWWPEEIPYENVRIDRRSKEQKMKMSYTDALRKIVYNCYSYYKREDLLPSEEPTTFLFQHPMLVQTEPTCSTFEADYISEDNVLVQTEPNETNNNENNLLIQLDTTTNSISETDGNGNLELGQNEPIYFAIADQSDITVQPANFVLVLPDGKEAKIEGFVFTQ